MIKYTLSTLPNGLRIISAPMEQTKAVTLLILVGIGSRYETDKQAGISHFLEHMFFKGTKNRPTYKEIATELDYLGGDFNAYTGEEYTGYFVQASADKFPKALDILSDMFFNSTFPQAEIEREKGVICEEINMYEDQPQSKVAEEAQKLVFAGSTLGRPIIGSKETVKSVTQKDLINYHQSMYNPENTIVVVAGAQEKFDWQREIANKFARWKVDKVHKVRKVHKVKSGSKQKIIHRKTDQAHFVLAFPTFKITDKRRPQLRVMTNLLGGMMSSRLFEEVREKRGLAYYVGAGTSDHHDVGAFYVRAGVMLDKTQEAIRVVFNELEKISKTSPSSEELVRSKENMKGQIYLGLEDSQSVAQYLANRILYHNTIIQPENVVEQIEKVTAKEISDLAQQLFTQQNRTLAVIGPFTDTQFSKLI
ncbi:hypothetical protein COS66_03400 [Candidatus Berkelbacteria bacterium CG06_land_8_20_14_3_00_43_10]|nr:MAG: hypothetical protein COS66_03400 [Candidatus Berkelbacteria bacterium CG06_land_8_20_14_3_00_43_10]